MKIEWTEYRGYAPTWMRISGSLPGEEPDARITIIAPAELAQQLKARVDAALAQAEAK